MKPYVALHGCVTTKRVGCVDVGVNYGVLSPKLCGLYEGL